MENILEVRNLSISFPTYTGTVQAVRDISFDVKTGKTLAIVGESGSGKTVTAKSLMGLTSTAAEIGKESSIQYQGKELTNYTVKEWNQYRGKEVAMVFQDALAALNPTVQIGTQVTEGLKNHLKLSKEEQRLKAIELLRLVGIPNPENCMKMYPHELSGGMRQRVMIASALITEPKVLIADEPTTSLDVTIQAQIIDLMKELQKKFHMTVILITHDMGLVADFADEILVMYAGKIVERGTSDEIFYHPQHPYTYALLHAVPSLHLNKRQKLSVIKGNVPDMTRPPKGCAFANRCKYTMRVCCEEQPQLYTISDTQCVSCWLQEEEASKEGVEFEVGGYTDGTDTNS